MNQKMKSTTRNDDEKDASRRDTVLLEACKKELSEEVQLGQAVLNVIQMWKDSAVVRSIKNHEKKNGRASSSAFEDERENWKSSLNGQRSRKSSERDRTPVLQKDSTSNVLKATTAAKSQQKEIQIVIRNPGRNGVSNKESAVKIVIKLPNGSNQPSPVNIPDATEAKVTQPSNETEEPDHQTNVQSPDVPEQEPEEVPNQEPEKPPDQEPSPDVVEIPVKEISETQVILPPITEPLASEPNREFKRLIHVNNGKRRAPSLISIRKATVTTASLRMREVDGVYCSNNGVYIGHDRKLYNTFKDASQTSRVDQILENFKGMRNGNIGKPEFLYDQANDEVFQTHLDTFRRGNSRKSRINGSVVLAASKLYSQARTRKAKAYSNLHKNLTSAVNY